MIRIAELLDDGGGRAENVSLMLFHLRLKRLLRSFVRENFGTRVSPIIKQKGPLEASSLQMLAESKENLKKHQYI